MAPEGTRLHTSEVGAFKKGAFRMAMAAGIPIVPIVFRHAEMVAGRNASAMTPGTVEVSVLVCIPVDTCTLERLDEHIDSVRRLLLHTLRDWPGQPSPEPAPSNRRERRAGLRCG